MDCSTPIVQTSVESTTVLYCRLVNRNMATPPVESFVMTIPGIDNNRRCFVTAASIVASSSFLVCCLRLCRRVSVNTLSLSEFLDDKDPVFHLFLILILFEKNK